MRKNYLVVLLFLFSLYEIALAQCPPPGTPTSTNTCNEAQYNCLDLDGYCGTINNNNVQQPFPGCPNNVLNNDEWFAFYAGTSTIAIQITPSNCQSGGQQGLQGGIYQACGPPWVAMDLQCPCTTNPFTLNSSNFVVGQIYYIVLDGCAGNVCDYSVAVTQGSTVGEAPADPGAVTGPSPVCQNTTSTYTVPAVLGATAYQWTMNPSLGTFTSTTNTVNVNWTTPGTTQLCVTSSNVCFANPTPSCIPITVVAPPTAALSGSGTLCEGPSGSVDLTVNFTPVGGGPWTFVYAINGVNQAPITTSNNPYTITATQPGNYTLVSVNYPSPNCPGTVSGSSNITIAQINTSSNVTPDICGQGIGDINLTVTPAGTYDFDWSNGAMTEDLTDVASGNYTVTITNSAGCTETASFNIPNDPITINITGQTTPNTTCNGGNGDIDISVTPANTYTYAWSNGASTQDLTDVTPGTYTVTVSFGTTCTGTASFTVANQPDNPNISSTTTPSICELANGDINVSVSGGVTPYTFAWSNGETTEDLNDVLSGSYTVTVTGANGCTDTETINLSNNNPTISLTANTTPNTTCNGGNGSITLTISPPTPPVGGNYTINWSNGATGTTLTDLTQGSYTVTVDGGGACTQTATFNIANQPNTPNISAAPTPSICELANGDINMTVSGGVSPYTFAWSNGETTEDLNDVLAGSYSVTVTGANGCTTSTTVPLANNNPPITINGTVTPNTTCIGGNGGIVISISPPTPPAGGNYTIAWSNGTNGTGNPMLQPGTYTVTVDGGGACTQTASFTIPDQPNTPSLSMSVTPDLCNQGNGAVSVSVSNGLPPFTYLWSDGSSGPGINGLPTGSYSVTVTGANGCTSAATATVPNNNLNVSITPTVTANTNCNGTGNGTISIAVTPPGANVTWSTGATNTTSINGLLPGSYSVTVSAGGTCTQEATITVPDQPNTPTVNTIVTAANCGLPNGEAEVVASGGVPGYTYQWSNGGSSPLISPIAAGTYTVTVTGANGCTSTASADVQNEQIQIDIFSDITPNTSCQAPNGVISLTVTPPTAGVLWSNGMTTPTISNLAPGVYSVTVNAGGTCTTSTAFSVPDMSEIPFLSYDANPSTCSQPNGSIDLTVNNGVPPFDIIWSNGIPFEDLTGVAPGLYSVTVTSATGCQATTVINVPNNNTTFNLTGTPTANTSCSSPNGGVLLSVSPSGTYTYAWSNSATTQNINNVPAGSYTVTVSAGGSCTAVGTYQVANNATAPTLSTTPTSATCGLGNGSVNLTISGGTTPYSIVWSNMATTEDIANVPAGTYTVTVTGANGCSATASANVGNTNTSPNVTGVTVANTSCTTNNGGVNITVSPSGTYTYAWSNSASTEDISNVAAGTYTVTVSAGGSCTSTASFTIDNNVSDPDIAESITPAICSEPNGGINLTITGATMPYTFAWSNSASTEDIANVLPGNYTVTVTGANGCSSTETFNVPNNSSSFSLSGTAQPLSSCSANNGSVNLTITPSGTYNIAWSNSASTEDIANLPAGTYTVTVTESGSCSATASFVVDDVTESPTLAQATTPEVCDLINGSINLTVSGSTTPYVFAWSNMAATEDLTNIVAGTYTVTVTGANGCSSTTTANVPGNTIAFSINGTTAANTSCAINNGGIDITVSPAGTYTYQWSNTATSEDLTGLTGGTYTVTVSAGGSCTDEATFTVGSTTLDPVVSSTLSPAICGESNGAIELTISGGVSPFTFDWVSGQSSEDLANIPPGSYTVAVEGANGCVTTANFTVQNNSIPINITGAPVANTACDVSNGAVNITIAPLGTYGILWSNGLTTEDIAGLDPGMYSVTVTQGLTCSAEANFTVANNTNAPIFSQTVDAATCGLSNGGINLNVNGGSLPYNFIWSNGEITEDLSGIAPGSYQVTVTGSDGCANTGDYVVPDDVLQLDINGAPTANTECLSGNGSIDLTVLPTGNYNYVWSNGETTADLSNLPAGTYVVTVSFGLTCSGTSSVVVLDQPDVPSITDQIVPSICGAPDGGINLTVSGGMLPYTFAWSNSASSEDLIGVNAGDYDVTVTAANGCSVTGSFNIPSVSNTFSFTGAAAPNTFCGSGNGAVNLTVTPAGVYTFIWSNGEMTEDITGLAPGAYEVTVSDGGSCTASQQFIVDNNAPTVSLIGTPTDVLCFGASTGGINLTPSGGVAPYVFSWSPGIPGDPEDPTGLTAGNYAVTVIDASGCQGTASFSIDEPATATQLLCTQSQTVSLPGQTDGAAIVTISGGTAPYIVDWNPGGQQAGVTAGDFAINNLGTGAYSVAVTDANGCPANCGFNITTDDCVTAVGTMGTAQLTTCGDGCITANYSAFGSYLDTNDVLQYVLHTGNSNQILNEILRSSQPTFCFNDALMNYGTTYYISAVAGNDDGTGNVLLTDACTQVSVGTPIVFYEIPVASIAQPGQLSCTTTQVTLQGGSTLPGSTYAWTTQGGNIVGSTTSPNIVANAPGNYTLTVTRNGCTSTASVQVVSIVTNVVVNIVSSPGELLDCIISEIDLNANVTGSTNPSFVWTLNGQPIGNDQGYTTQSGGTYVVVVTDPASGCTGTASIVISDNTDYPAVETNPAPLMNCQDTVVTISGTSPVNGVTFEWVTINGTDTIVVGQGASIQVNSTGTYYLVGTAPNGCQNAEALLVSGDFATPTANAGPDETLDCYQTPLGLTGSGSAGVSFFWTTSIPGVTISNPTEPVITVAADGIYTLTVTDLGNFCTDSDDVEVFQYVNVPQAEVLAEDPNCAGDINGSIELTADPSNGPYNFELNGQDYGTQNYFAPLAPGTYEIVVTDGQGCSWTTQVTLNDPEELVVDLGTNILVNLGETATIQAQYTVPSSQLDTLIWTPSDLFPCPQMPCNVQEFLPTQQTVVTLTVIDENGCEADDLLTVFVKKDNPVYVPNSFSPNGDGVNDVFMIFSGKEVVNIKKFLVFDRWGETVYEYFNFVPNNPANGWDGTLRGETMNPAVFAWFAVVEFLDGSEVLLEGDVTLVR